MTLSIQVTAMAGDHLLHAMYEMLDLAQKLQCGVDMKANGVEFWVHPTDTREDIRDAWDRLYPASRIISTGIRNPVP